MFHLRVAEIDSTVIRLHIRYRRECRDLLRGFLCLTSGVELDKRYAEIALDHCRGIVFGKINPAAVLNAHDQTAGRICLCRTCALYCQSAAFLGQFCCLSRKFIVRIRPDHDRFCLVIRGVCISLHAAQACRGYEHCQKQAGQKQAFSSPCRSAVCRVLPAGSGLICPFFLFDHISPFPVHQTAFCQTDCHNYVLV